jgi:hypothetical protein
MPPDNKKDKARQMVAINLLMRFRAHTVQTSPSSTDILMLLDRMLSEVEPADLELCSRQPVSGQPLPQWAGELILALIEAYDRYGVHARELWQRIPASMIVTQEEQQPDASESGSTDDGSSVAGGKADGAADTRGGDNPQAGSNEDGIRDSGAGERVPVPIGANRSDGFRGGFIGHHQHTFGRFPELGPIGCEPIKFVVSPLNPSLARQVKTTQVLPTGHLFEMRIDFGARHADWCLWPPGYGPHSGKPSLMHGRIGVPQGSIIDESWFQAMAACMLGEVVRLLENRFPLYRLTPNNAETS